MVCALGCMLGFALGCQNYRDQLQRGQGYYEENQYESALAVFRHLEADRDSLSEPEVVRYCYLRGMTDFRLGYKSHARYWLGLAQAADKPGSGSLSPEEQKRMGETLNELNGEVYGTSKSGTSKTGEEDEALGDSCHWTSDCETGFLCQDGICIQAETEDESGDSEATSPQAE